MGSWGKGNEECFNFDQSLPRQINGQNSKQNICG